MKKFGFFLALFFLTAVTAPAQHSKGGAAKPFIPAHGPGRAKVPNHP